MSIGYKNRRRKAAGGISRRTMQSGPMFVLQYIPPAETQPDRAIEASIKTLLLVAVRLPGTGREHLPIWGIDGRSNL